MTSTIQAGDWTGSLGGLSVGVGTPYQVAALHGWKLMTALPLGGASSGGGSLPAPKAYANGSWGAPYFMPKREVTILLDIVESGSTTFATAVAQLEAATGPQGDALVALSMQLDGQSTTVYGAVTSRDIPTEFEYQFGLSRATITLECPDPRRLAADVSATTRLPLVAGGVTWPVTWPISWPGNQVSGNLTLSNPGNTTGPMKLRINGPVTAPVVTCNAGGVVSRLAFSSSLVIASGDWVDIDCEARTVLYNGQVSRNGMLTSRGWFGFATGDNVIGFNASSADPSAQLQATGTPAWI